MWKCCNCAYDENEDNEPGCRLCDAPRGFDPDAETKILPAVKLIPMQTHGGLDREK